MAQCFAGLRQRLALMAQKMPEVQNQPEVQNKPEDQEKPEVQDQEKPEVQVEMVKVLKGIKTELELGGTGGTPCTRWRSEPSPPRIRALGGGFPALRSKHTFRPQCKGLPAQCSNLFGAGLWPPSGVGCTFCFC